MSPPRARFSARRVAAFTDAQILGVRSGTEHRYTGVWLVVVEDPQDFGFQRTGRDRRRA